MTALDPIRAELGDAVARSRTEITQPGAWWSGPERTAIGARARAAFAQSPPSADDGLPEAAGPVIDLLACRPAHTTRAWVDEATGELGEARYVELVGVVARTIAADTFDRLRGIDPPPIADPAPGDPSHEPVPDTARRNRTWVSLVTPAPPMALGAVPSAERAMNDLCDELYLPVEEIGNPQFHRGSLTRPQIELVAATTSHVNECFY